MSYFNENWYLGVIWRAEHDGTIKFSFRVIIFFHAVLMTAYCYAMVDRWAIQAPGSLLLVMWAIHYCWSVVVRPSWVKFFKNLLNSKIATSSTHCPISGNASVVVVRRRRRRPSSSLLTFFKNLLLKNCLCYRLETLAQSSIGYLDYNLCLVCSPSQKHGRRC